MIIKEKILIEVESPCLLGLTYSYVDCVGMILKIKEEEISGDIYGDESLKGKSFYKVINPQMIVDENDDNKTLYLIVDIEFDDKKYSKEELLKFNEGHWRLAIEGEGDIKEGLVENYKLKKVNIEFIPEEVYNELNS